MTQKSAFFQTPEIYFPELFTAVPHNVMHIEMSGKEAAAAGFAFRKKRHSVKITNYHGKPQKQLMIPYTIDGMPVDEIRSETFRKFPCSTVFIHGNIRKLGEGVFRESTVKNVIFEDGITVLPKYAFSYCENLEKVCFPTTLKMIRFRCFALCRKLKYVEFPKSIRILEEYAFVGSGIERFGVECFMPAINNADAFCNTPLLYDIPEQVVCTYPDSSNLTVLHVNGGPFKLKADSVTFCKWSLHSNDLDLSECGKIRFLRYAVRDELPRSGMNTAYYCKPCVIKLPENRTFDQYYPFPKHVTVAHYFPQKDRTYSRPFQSADGSRERSLVITPVADYLPWWSVQGSSIRLRISKGVKIDRNAIKCSNLEEITFEDFSPEDRIFSFFCHEVRKVSFSRSGRMYTKYIPPAELTNGLIHRLFMMAFAPCSAPCGNGFRRTVYDRRIIDSIFNSGSVSTANNPWLKNLLDGQNEGASHPYDCPEFAVTNKFKALIAADVLRSDRLEHEPPVDMYYNFLKKHRSLCKHYFRKIGILYPEYLEAFEKMFPADH